MILGWILFAVSIGLAICSLILVVLARRLARDAKALAKRADELNDRSTALRQRIR